MVRKICLETRENWAAVAHYRNDALFDKKMAYDVAKFTTTDEIANAAVFLASQSRSR
jgi:hypothetical protein